MSSGLARTTLDGAVSLDPEILGGAPVFAGTRVPIENLFDFLGGGYDLDEFLKAFPRVRREDAQKVLDASSDSLVSQMLGRAA